MATRRSGIHAVKSLPVFFRKEVLRMVAMNDIGGTT